MVKIIGRRLKRPTVISEEDSILKTNLNLPNVYKGPGDGLAGQGLANKPDDLSSIPSTHMEKKRTDF